MTRKHFEGIAGMLKLVRNESDEDNWNSGVTAASYAIATYLATQNERFDREKFLVAAGAMRKVGNGSTRRQALRCKYCAQPLSLDRGILIDPTGGDVCGWDGGNEPHEKQTERGTT
jgi:hypothetical protein